MKIPFIIKLLSLETEMTADIYLKKEVIADVEVAEAIKALQVLPDL
jgi:hypothetical protein